MNADLSKRNLLMEVFVLGMHSCLQNSRGMTSKERADKSIESMEELAQQYGFKMEDFDRNII